MLRPGSDIQTDQRMRDRTLRRYARTRNPRELEALVLSYTPLARSLARRYSTASASPEDFEQAAYEGLVKAIRRFEPDRGVPFASFAVPTILGDLRRFVRDTAWPARVPRSLQERVRGVRDAVEALSAKHGRTPTARELAHELGWEHDAVVEALEVSSSLASIPLDAPAGNDSAVLPVAERIGADDPGFDRVECLSAIEAELPVLDRRQKEVMRLHFAEELTQRQIALRLGVSRSAVARDLGGAVQSLRAALAAGHAA